MKAVRFSFLIYFGLIESALRMQIVEESGETGDGILERNGKGMNVPTSGEGKRRFLCELCAYLRLRALLLKIVTHPSNRRITEKAICFVRTGSGNQIAPPLGGYDDIRIASKRRYILR